MRQSLHLLRSLWMLACMLCSLQVVAQEQNTFFYQHLPQAQQLNPAKLGEYRFSLTIPAISHQLYLGAPGLSYNKLVREESGKKVIQLGRAIEGLQAQNNLYAQMGVELFGLQIQGIGPKRVSFQLFAREQTHMLARYPKEMFSYFTQGNAAAANLGREVSITPTLYGIQYTDLGVGMGFDLNPKLRVGATAHLLFGKGFVDGQDLRLSAHTAPAPSYAITIGSSGHVRTAGVAYLDDSLSSSDPIEYLLNTQNMGIAFDLGVTYEPVENLFLEASVRNLGSIQWKGYVSDYILGDGNRRSYTFQGVTTQQILDNNMDISLQDSLQDLLTPSKVDGSNKAFRGALPTSFLLGARYELPAQITGGLLYQHTKLGKEQFGAFTASIDKKFGELMGLGLSYTYSTVGSQQLGGIVSLGFNNLRIFMASDNLLSGLLMPKKASSLGYRLGINLQGRNIEKAKSKRMAKTAMGSKRLENSSAVSATIPQAEVSTPPSSQEPATSQPDAEQQQPAEPVTSQPDAEQLQPSESATSQPDAEQQQPSEPSVPQPTQDAPEQSQSQADTRTDDNQ